MALKTRSVTSDGKRVMTMEEFKRWLKKFDADKDGRISKNELREAIYATGGRFATWKSHRGIKSVDANGNGFIDEGELNNLVEFAEKHLGIRIAQF
ncbi:Calcium-binding EF-hand [Quillaja saponaria]|uniref:Calcium-binding EF-hand n=1 Tax=Quillaja saponaria TaxID=32244 RepID=A0AAD7LHQ6_QUISA|nr:Calcium-binding EF-hand [Quillaja saponaria]